MIHVAVGVIRRADDSILVARRAPQAHQGGLWEFPGGKVEPGETVQQALQRELEEELALTVRRTSPLCQVRHDYGDRQVLLDVWTVNAWDGEPQPREGQPLRWVAARDLQAGEFPAANRPIIRCLQLSDRIAITPGTDSPEEAIRQLQTLAGRHDGLIQLRQPAFSAADWERLMNAASDAGGRLTQRLLINHDPVAVADREMAGCHLTAQRLMACRRRPVPDAMLLGASCHSAEELRQAERIGADYVFLSPVLPTASHPEATPLGWKQFRELTARLTLPVYALGGMRHDDLAIAREHGARGIAGIGFAALSSDTKR